MNRGKNSQNWKAGTPQQKRAAQSKPPVLAPSGYRPQPTPKVLQLKTREQAFAPPHKNRAPSSFIQTQPALDNRRSHAAGGSQQPPAKPRPLSKNVRQTGIQRTPSRVVQAVKFFPNLHPGSVESVNPSSIFKLNSFADQYRLHRVNSHGVNVPNQQYNFVRTREGEMLLHNRYRHPSIAEGKQVLYAGEVFFNNGRLQWWSNGSGHYQPGAEDAEQAKLPMERFYSYQQIIKGEHTRKKDKS